MPDYYKTNTEVAKEFGVAESTVRNWLNRAIDKELNLQIEMVDAKFKLLKNSHNQSLIRQLIEQGRKHRSSNLREEVQVDDKLYDILNRNQLLTLINSLRVKREIPLKYAYLNFGAEIWDKFYKSTSQSSPYSTHSSDVFLLDKLYELISEHFQAGQKLNMIDLGCGNGFPVIPLLQKLNEADLVNSYIAIDISKEVLEITKANILQFFPSLNVEMVQLDFETHSIQEVLYAAKLGQSRQESIPNLVLMLGSTLPNIDPQIQPLLNIQAGLTAEDYLITSNAINNPATYSSFPAFENQHANELVIHLANLIGLNRSNTEIEKIYNPVLDRKEYNLVLKKDLTINFPIINQTVELLKGEKVNVWKFKRDTFESILKKSQDIGLVPHFIVKNPKAGQIMYMLGVV
jgi:uncharacterized SAM-dependent methyltransferase/transposase-like protein